MFVVFRKFGVLRMDKQFYRTDEVATLLGTWYQNVFYLRKSAGVKPVRFKGSHGVWYTKEQIDKMREVQEQPWLAVDAEVEEVLPV